MNRHRKTPDSKRRARIARQCLTRLDELRQAIGGEICITLLGVDCVYFPKHRVLILYQWAKSSYYIYHPINDPSKFIAPVSSRIDCIDKITGVEKLFRLKGWTRETYD